MTATTTADSVILVIPTYNESANIAPLVENISQAINGYDYEILFVDDNSSDGTAGIARQMADRYPVRVIVRTDEKGLASAVVRGFENSSQQLIVVMDADLQHPPEIIPSLLSAIEGGANISIGSRYIKGGGCEGWSLIRRIMSKGAAFIAHLFLPSTRKIHDPMSGFFALRREVIEGISLNPYGFKILLEILMLGKWQTVREVPFMFVTRQRGESKLNAAQQLDYLKHIYSLMQRSGELMRFIKFCLVGASGVVVNYGLYWLLTRFAGFTPIADTSGGILSGNIALTISIETSIITNFILNNFFTFSDRNMGGFGGFLKRLVNFNLICILGGLIQIGVANLMAVLLGLHDMIAVLIGIVIAFFWNYLVNNYLTWRK